MVRAGDRGGGASAGARDDDAVSYKPQNGCCSIRHGFLVRALPRTCMYTTLIDVLIRMNRLHVKVKAKMEDARCMHTLIVNCNYCNL